MGKYLAERIFKGKLDYDAVVAKYPQCKEEIDYWLAAWGWNED